MAVLRGAAGWIIRQAAAMQAAAGGRRWRACPPRWRRWRLRCCCEVWQGWQAVGAVQVGQGWRWCGVIVGGGLLLAWSSGAALAVLILPGAGGGRCGLLRRRGAGVVIDRAGPSLIRTDPAGDPVQRAGSRAVAGRWAKEKGQGRRRGVRCCSGLWSALAAMVPAGCVPVPVVGPICWRCRWAWSALAPFPLSAFQRHGWRWRCSIRAGFGRLPEGSDSPPNGSEKQV